MKPFSVHGEGKAISLYNPDRKRSARNAPMKSQCARDYFYGTEVEIEKWLGDKEKAFTKVRDNINSLKNNCNDEIEILRKFVLLQYLRTDAAAQRASAAMSEMADIAKIENLPERS